LAVGILMIASPFFRYLRVNYKGPKR
jgi:hypothetical protein